MIFGTTPLSLIKLPSIKQPIKGAALGTISTVMTVTIIGNKIFSFLETSLGFYILIALSFLVVNNLIIGG